MQRTVKEFGAAGDGATDDTTAIEHALVEGSGELYFPPGDYRLTRTVEVKLAETGRFSLQAAGGAKIIMAGAGPAFSITGTHLASASPDGFKPEVWQRERMPFISGIEIEGAHPEADGFRFYGTMQGTLQNVLLHKLRHGVHIFKHARNVLIADSHIYNNSGIGVFMEEANLHQVVICGCHISYCKGSGIKILNGQVRNFQFTGNDIEYNFDPEAPAPTAEVWIEASGEKSAIREGTITGNTIQSRYAPGGSNIRIIGGGAERPHEAGMLSIAGNLIGSQEVNVRLEHCRAVVLTGNTIYSGHLWNVEAKGCRNLLISGNSFDHNPDYLPRELCTGVRFEDCYASTFSASSIQDADAGKHTVETPAQPHRQGLVEVVRCRHMLLQGLQVLDAAPTGIHLEACEHVQLNGCSVADTREAPMMKRAVRWQGPGKDNAILGCCLGAGTEKVLDVAEESGVTVRSV